MVPPSQERKVEGALWRTATGPHRKPVEQAKYQPAEKEVALRGHSCVAAGDVGKRQDHKSLEGDARFPNRGQAVQMFI